MLLAFVPLSKRPEVLRELSFISLKELCIGAAIGFANTGFSLFLVPTPALSVSIHYANVAATFVPRNADATKYLANSLTAYAEPVTYLLQRFSTQKQSANFFVSRLARLHAALAFSSAFSASRRAIRS